MRLFDPRLTLMPEKSRPRQRALPSSLAYVLVACGGLAAAAWLLPTDASAHVKWFAPTNVGEDPMKPIQLGNPMFWTAIILACLALYMASFVEQTPAGQRFVARIEATTSPWSGLIEQMVRVAAGGFFLSLWAHGGVLLTPELATDSALIAWLQLGISACMLDRRLLPLGALGILVLYAEGIRQFGAFHMIDYAFFPGTAAYLALAAATSERMQDARVAILRLSLAFSLMWVSIEKFAYPHWTLCVLREHPVVTFGLDPHMVTQLAGVVEFSLAFSLLWTSLIRRAAALVLAGFMSAAILEFGKIDAIGHMIPIALLIAVALDQSQAPARRYTLSPFLLCGSLGVVFSSYYLAQRML